MNKMMILLNDFEKIKRFTQYVSTFEDDVDMVRNRYVIDAKSTIGIFTLDLSKPVDIIIHTENPEEIERFNKLMEEFKWEDH